MENKEELLKIGHYDLDKIRLEFLKYAPAYAISEAKQALNKILELQAQGIIRNGIYYIVLVDLVGSTKYSAEYGNAKMSDRIKQFITESFNALTYSKICNTGIFLKELGDAVLYVFQHFPDILKWRDSLQNSLNNIGKYQNPYVLRTCIHIGEISLEGVNPLCLAVSQTFKMEKSVEAGTIALSEPAYHVAWPTIKRAYHGFSNYIMVEMDGFKDPVQLYKLELHDENDLSRIVEENETAD